MLRIRLWVSVSFLWLTLFFNIERLHEPINIASFVYVLAAVLGAVTVALAPLKRLDATWLLLGAFGVFLLTKRWLGYPLLGQALPLTVTEGLAIATTVILARQITQSIKLFEDGMMDLAGMHWVQHPASFEQMQNQLYREVSRARRYERPLSLLTIRVASASEPQAVHRMVEEMQRKMAKHCLDAKVLELLTEDLHESNLVAQQNGHFIVLLAEADTKAARQSLYRLRARLEHDLGVQVEGGIATFPEQEVTLAGLLQRAEEQMNVGQPTVLPDSSPTDDLELRTERSVPC